MIDEKLIAAFEREKQEWLEFYDILPSSVGVRKFSDEEFVWEVLFGESDHLDYMTNFHHDEEEAREIFNMTGEEFAELVIGAWCEEWTEETKTYY